MKNLLRSIVILAGTALGPGVVILVYGFMKTYFGLDPEVVLPAWANMLVYISSALIFGIIFFFLSRPITDGIKRFGSWLEKKVSEQPAKVSLAAMGGVLLGMLAGFLLSKIIEGISVAWLSIPLNILLYVICVYIFSRIAMLCARKLFLKKRGGDESSAKPNILDTSAIIDGRIFDICKTGIIEGRLIVPGFVLDELRHIADSGDALKRSKGRRGLDTLNRIQKELDVAVEVSSADYEDISEVDVKLLRLAEDEGGRVITNDFNLNKVASVRGVKVFNINDLANAVKPVLVAGEQLSVAVMKEGKDPTQGIGYLEDGTMIVVESGRRFIGQTIAAEVTSILQTSAGRMIFAKPVQ